MILKTTGLHLKEGCLEMAIPPLARLIVEKKLKNW